MEQRVQKITGLFVFFSRKRNNNTENTELKFGIKFDFHIKIWSKRFIHYKTLCKHKTKSTDMWMKSK